MRSGEHADDGTRQGAGRGARLDALRDTRQDARRDAKVRWPEVLLAAAAAVSWAMIGMTGTAALGLHLLGADAAGSLWPMAAATVALGAGGSVTPSGDVSAFGLDGAQAHTAIALTPLGVSLVGALLLAWLFLRSLRTLGAVAPFAELAARAGAVIVLFVAMLGGLAWAGHDVVTIDGGTLGLDRLRDGGLPGDVGDKLPDALGDIGGIGDIPGLLPDRIGDLVKAKAAVGFTVDTGPTLLGGAAWVAGVLLIALLASRRTPLPRGWSVVHRAVRPAVSALATVLLVSVVAGLAAAAYAAIGDEHPRRIAGAALLGAPNGVWLGIPVGLFVPWDGTATGELAKALPDPLDELLRVSAGDPVTLGRLADLDGRVWLLGVGAAVTMLLAGVLTATRTPWVRGGGGARQDRGARQDTGARQGGVAGGGAARFAGRCALRLGVVTALGLPLLVWLTGVSANASLSVLGVDAFGAGIELHGRTGTAVLLGAAWGAGAGAAGALLAHATGSAGRWATALARASGGPDGGHGLVEAGDPAGGAGLPGGGSGPGGPGGPGGSRAQGGSDVPGGGEPGRTYPESAQGPGPDPGPYHPSAPYKPPNEDTNPYLRPPDDVHSAPTMAGPLTPSPPPPKPRTHRGPWPTPPPPPPLPPPPPDDDPPRPHTPPDP